MRPRKEANSGQYCGNEPWSVEQEVVLARSWYSVSANPLGNGTGKKFAEFWDHGLIAYFKFCKDGGIKPATPKRAKLPYRPRTARALQAKWKDVQHDCSMFLSEDIRASHIIAASGETEEDFRNKARKFYAEKHGIPFAFEQAYNFLKGKQKFYIDIAQLARNEHALGKDGNPLAVKRRGGPGSRHEKRKRPADSGTEDEGEKVPGQKLARRLQKEAVAAAAATAENLAAIDAERHKYQERAQLQHRHLDTEKGRQETERVTAEVAMLQHDKEIMMLDLSDMPDFRRAYFENEMMEACERQAARKAKKVADVENARIATEDAIAAAIEEAERAAAYAASAEGIAAALAADEAERARAQAMARAATGPSIIEDHSSAPFGDSTDPLNHLSEGEESEEGEEEEEESELIKWAKVVEAFAAQRGDDTVPGDIYVPDTTPDTILGTPIPSFQTP